MPTTVTLESTQTVNNLEQLDAALKAGLGSELILDGSSVSKIDTASLQLITACFLYAQKSGQVCQLQPCSDYLQKQIALLGLSEIIRT